MEEYSVDRFTTNCEHCGKASLHQGRWIDFGRSDKYVYRCGWCSEVTSSTWIFADPSIVGLFLSLDGHSPIYDLPTSFHQYPLKEF